MLKPQEGANCTLGGSLSFRDQRAQVMSFVAIRINFHIPVGFFRKHSDSSVPGQTNKTEQATGAYFLMEK